MEFVPQEKWHSQARISRFEYIYVADNHNNLLLIADNHNIFELIADNHNTVHSVKPHLEIQGPSLGWSKEFR